MDVDYLRCEYMVNPLGLDISRPRLSWQMQAKRRGAHQTAYQIVAASQVELLPTNSDIWDSGLVVSNQSIHIEFAGPPLESRQQVWWRVRVCDDSGQLSPWSRPAWWEMGLLDPGDWQATWIGGWLSGGPHTCIPAPFMRKDFKLPGPVASGRLYATALGLYELELNGQRVGESVFTPGWSDYHKRIAYQVYDVTALLQQGENVIGAVLGDGWYCGHVAWFGRQVWGKQPRLLVQLEIKLENGQQMIIISDENWKTAYGPLLQSDLIMGEHYDARLEFPGWSQAGFDDRNWPNAKYFPDPGCVRQGMRGPAVKRISEIKPVSMRAFKCWDGTDYVFDMGQNMVGRVRLQVSGARGATVRLRFGEMLNPDGTLYTANLRSAAQTDYYTLRGDPNGEIYEPRFTFHGFRYVEMRGFPGEPSLEMLTGVVLHSDTPSTGVFLCSDEFINQLQHNIIWGQKGNFLEVPMDCPQRDERLGWTGDAQAFVRTATFNMEVAAFFTKWLHDLADAQAEDGRIPPVAPAGALASADGGPAWSDAVVICPWVIYQRYGDRRILEELYEAMKRFVNHLEAKSKGYIRSHPDVEAWGGYGDWLSIQAETPKDLIGTAFFAYSAHLLSQAAAVIGKLADARRYQLLYENIRTAFQHRFVSAQGLVVSGSQTAYTLALSFDLLGENQRITACQALRQDIEKRGLHLSTGFVGAPFLPFVLSDHGALDLAYTLLNQQTWPSWIYPVTQGATTIWERWDGWTHEKGFQDPGMNSFNHYAYGSIGAWLYAVIGGIDLLAPGFQRIRIRPRPGGSLIWARAGYESPYGRIDCAWHLEGSLLHIETLIPPNTSAEIHLPVEAESVIQETGGMLGVMKLRTGDGEVVYETGAGEYHFVLPVPGALESKSTS